MVPKRSEKVFDRGADRFIAEPSTLPMCAEEYIDAGMPIFGLGLLFVLYGAKDCVSLA